MNSSIFSSKYEIPVIASVAIALLVGELTLRKFEMSLSKDVANISAIAEQSRELGRSEKRKLAVLGNSMLRRGIVPDVFKDGVNQRLGDIAIEFFYIDGSDVLEWQYAFEKDFIYQKACVPDMILFGFSDQLLSDSHEVRPQRLASLIRGDRLGKAIFEERLSYDEAASLLAAYYACIVRNGDRIRSRILDFVPYNREFTRRVNIENRTANRTAKSRSDQRRTELAEKKEEWRRLRRFLEMLERQHVALVAVSMPYIDDYEISSDVERLFQVYDVTFIDGRNPRGLIKNSRNFCDRVHLTEEGANIFTLWLAERLNEASSDHAL